MKSGETVWIGFDLGGTKMQATVYDSDFKAVESERKKTKAQDGVSAGLDRIVETIEEALKKAGGDKGNIAGIGLGYPGPLDLDKGVILESPNLGWREAPVKEHIEKAFKTSVVVLNDADAGTYGEYRFGAARKARCVLGVFPGTGIGGGCVYEGKLIRGLNRSCVEIGHIQMMQDGPLCGCGRRGCLEALSGRLAIASAVAAAAYRGDAPTILASAGTDLSNIRSGAISGAIKAGDKAVESIVRNAARWLGRGVAVAVNLLAPDIVVLGGGLVEAMPGLFQEEVESSARDSVMPTYKKIFKVVVAELGDEATAKGAAAWAADEIQRLKKD